jgi:glutamate racemase
MELERLDSLLNAVWDQAMTGDTKAVDSALKVINARAKLLSLDQLTATQTTQNFNTVVVSGDSKDFISSLKLVES